jgi:hypothetical protein
MLDFTLLGNCSCVALPPASMQVVTPALSNKRGSLVLLQLIVFIMRKSCVDSYAPEGRAILSDYENGLNLT